jgi:uncharacterized Tic20 family protein
VNRSSKFRQKEGVMYDPTEEALSRSIFIACLIIIISMFLGPLMHWLTTGEPVILFDFTTLDNTLFTLATLIISVSVTAITIAISTRHSRIALVLDILTIIVATITLITALATHNWWWLVGSATAIILMALYTLAYIYANESEA